MFEKFGLADGYYKWSDEKFFENCHLFLKKLFNTKKALPKEHVWIMVALLYPKKAMTQDGDVKCQPLFEALGEEGVKVFKNIFDNNN